MNREAGWIGALFACLAVVQPGQAAEGVVQQTQGGGEVPAPNAAVTLQQAGGVDPTLAFDGRTGALYVAWARRTDAAETAPLEVVVARSDDGGHRFADPVVVSDGERDVTSAAINPPQIAVGPNSEVYVLYQRRVVSPALEHGRGIPQLARSTDGGRHFASAVAVTAREQAASSAGMADLSIGPDGHVYVAWLDDRKRLARQALPADQRPQDVAWLDADDPKVQVRIARASAPELRFEPSVLIADNASERSRVAIAAGRDGTLYTAWRAKLNPFKGSYDAVRDILVSTSAAAGHTWSKPVKVHDDRFKAGSDPKLTVGMAIDAKGRLHVAWYTGSGLGPGVYYAESGDRGKHFSKPIALLSDDWVPYANVKLVVAEEGAAWVAFEDRREEYGERVTVLRIDQQGNVSAPRYWRGSGPDVAVEGDAAVLTWMGAGGAIRVVRLAP
ncbi:sialidase/neuraminidase family protein [Nitrococcus mobilis]|uniref:BNR/Asp-box repeat domain protein n=1 Tax=Nitrococcus mobilis Nb-231 TaxID=314278 RepID=A4BVH9_9GAMM|nr:hypothetical protein [Nitrococcus mobilis]EAR20299.1 BNR/Asp-box repeat domain protein [Nitrococcus mobilis Nb-231]